MNAKGHPAYEEEQKHLVHTKEWLLEQETKLEAEHAILVSEVSVLKKQVATAFDERLVLKQQMEKMVAEEQEKIMLAKSTPYFGRMNFVERLKDEVEVVYIGKNGIYDSEQGEMLVLDWRSPMANVYYSGMDEEVSYRTPKGYVEGTLLLKRRYVFEEGVLEEIHDEKSIQERLKDSIEADSGFLIESLNKSTKGRLKEIVATIQQEQNNIIRSESNRPLIVQGVAGSGKTTIALHRMAYLIYNKISNEEAHYMVVAPNTLFLHYIADILPDLGVQSVYQTVFEDWALKCLGKKFKLKKQEDRLDTLLSQKTEAMQKEVVRLSAKIRGSIALKKIIDMKLSGLERSIVPKKHIQYEDQIIITYKEVKEIFLVSNQHLCLWERIKYLGKYLEKRLKDKESLIKAKIEKVYREKIDTLREHSSSIEAIRPMIVALYDERDLMIKEMKKWRTQFVKDYLKEYEVPAIEVFYQGILEDEVLIGKLLQKHAEDEMIRGVIACFREKRSKLCQVETEDLGALVYIQIKLYGFKDQTKYKHIIVDEAQDLDEMKLTVLREIASGDSFTFVGDLSQGIYDYKGISNWEYMMSRVFEGKKYAYHELTTSYRSTIEIIDVANQIISQSKAFTPTLAKPVLRHGDKPKGVMCENDAERLKSIKKYIERGKAEGMHSIAILTKTKEVVKPIYEALKKEISIQAVEDQTTLYHGEVVVMPGYLSKGLEFDMVIIFDVSNDDKEVEWVDLKLYYVMMTRALHRVFMYSIGKPLALFDEIKVIEWSMD